MARTERQQSSNEAQPAAGLTPQHVLDVALRRAPLVLSVVGLALCAALAVLWTRPPVYRAKAKLLLDDKDASSGVLGELSKLTSAPQAAAEIELLRARTTLEQVVAQRPGAPAGVAADVRHLGLETLVEDQDLRPLPAALASLFGAQADKYERSLAAWLEADAALGQPTELSVEFLEDGRVRVRSAALSSALGLPAAIDLTARLRPGQPIALGAARLWLEPLADLTGRSFRIARLSRAEAIERVSAGLRVAETERNSGVLEITYDDSDPWRASATVQALCQNYLDRNQERTERRASQTVDFIAQQLDEQQKALSSAEGEVVALKSANPRAIDLQRSGEKLIDQMSGIEVERMQLSLARVALEEALALFERGEDPASSRLPAELLDPVSASYLAEIAKLSAESAAQGRSEGGPYKALLAENLLGVERQRDGVALALESARAAVHGLERGERGALSRVAAEASDPLLSGYLDQWSRAEAREAELTREFTAQHPDVIAARAESAEVLARIRAGLDGRVAALESALAAQQQLLASYQQRRDAQPLEERAHIASALVELRQAAARHLRGRLAGIVERELGLSEESRRLESELGRLPEEERAVAGAARTAGAHAEIVQFLLARQQEAEIARAASLPSCEVIDPAVMPEQRYGPSISMHVLAGLLLGLALGLGLALAREGLGRGVLFASELEEATGLPVLGSIPDFRRGRARVRGAGAHFLALRDDPSGPIAEAYRSLRSNLKVALADADDLRSLAFTSCVQGEGKSATNIDVALAFGLSGKRVCLVDADMRRPSVHAHLGLQLSPGLSDVLTGRSAWRECLRSSIAPGVDVLCAGRQPASPGELLEGPAGVRLVEELEREYDLVIFDVPPALAVADIDAFAQRIDAMVLLCRSNRVSGVVVAEAADRLRQVGANLIGAVLNAVGPASRSTKYGYGTGYGYGYGHGYGQRYESDRREPVAAGERAA